MGNKNVSNSDINLGFLRMYYTLDNGLFCCKLCRQTHKAASSRWISSHFESDMSEIRCKNLQRCPKCIQFVLKGGLTSHLTTACKFSDVHFMKCSECVAGGIITGPHNPVLLGCMRDFITKKLIQKGFKPSKVDLNDLYSPQNALKHPKTGKPRSNYDICMTKHTF